MSKVYNHNSLIFLTEQVAPIIVAVLSGTRNRADVQLWVDQKAMPSPEQTERINFAYSLFRRAIEVKGEDVGIRTTRAWFIGGNVGPELDTPMTGIREDRFDEVITSHKRMLEEDYMGFYCDEAATLAEKYCGVFLI